ncbi:Phospholipase A2, major isoenzyme [Holothuria leucospilota]|uniref:Phospholipase A2 n=1 Tax=Holothuria leucospilota TaxID=206669 RepID=A0A9Q1C7V9_HOLLE|nr:Phospholipase A2, major isoenzyme [Holothuria leucospilota]
MISCLTNRRLIQSWADYDGYGCYCGLGGTSSPLDETDSCCQQHDDCYGKVMTSGLCKFPRLVYVIHYEFSKSNCHTDFATVTCKTADEYRLLGSKYPECAAAMCKCDRQGAMCFASAYYDSEKKNYPQELC